MAKFMSLDHACVVVSDLEKAVSFWRDTLGWKVVREGQMAGSLMDKLIGVPGLKARQAVLVADEDVNTGMMELVEFSPPTSKPFPPDEKFNDVGLRMLSISVDDVDKAYEELKSKGCRFHSPPQPVMITRGVINKVCIFREPVDGLQIEIVQRS